MASETPSGSKTYDVAVVGAGPAGSATATHLARAGCRVALLDRARFPRDKPCAEYLSPGAEPLLRDLGVLDELERLTPAHLKGFRVFAPSGRMFQGDFAGTRAPNGTPLHTYGLAVPRLRLDAALLGAARTAGAAIFEGCRVANIERVAASVPVWRLLGADGSEHLHAHVLVAADGVHSTIARRLGLQRPGILRKVGLVAHLRGIQGLADYGEVHVAGRRYVGLAPLEPTAVGDLCNVAMVVDEAREGRHLAGHPQAFLLDALESFPRLHGRLSHVTVVRPTLTTSGICVRACRLADDGLLLVGDAAGYFDPFTGEGIYQALQSAQIAAGVIARALASGDVSRQALQPYVAHHRRAFKGKRTVEALVQSAIQVPGMMNQMARALARHKSMADTIVAVTGDYLPPSAILNPAYLLRLLV